MAFVDDVVGKFKDLSVNTKESPNESESAVTPSETESDVTDTPVNHADCEEARMKPVVNEASSAKSAATPDGSGNQINGPVRVNYADHKTADMQLVGDKLLEDLLVNSDSRRDIVIVGEGRNFTFSIALAKLRGSSWDGIVATRYEKESVSAPKPPISDVNLPSPPDGAWKFDIDATNLPADLSVDKKVVWFRQCPWIPRKRQDGIYDLISEFLTHMGEKQSENDYVLIGIANHDNYVKDYQLGKLLGENLSGPVGKYNFLGIDNALIKKIIRLGYKHESCGTDIHDYISDHHLTLIFKHHAGSLKTRDYITN